MPGPKPMQDLSSGGKNALPFASLQSTRWLPINCASSGRMSVNATLKCAGADVVEPEQSAFGELPPCSAFHTATGRFGVVSQANATFAPRATCVHALVGITSVALPAAPRPKNNRWPTIVSTERYAQMVVGVVSLSQATH